MPELLVEFFSEEIPARMQRRAGEDLQRLLATALRDHDLPFEDIKSFTTPRRLTVLASALPLIQPTREIERKGPRTDAPERAIEGFLGSVPVDLDQCAVVEDKKGAFYVARWTEEGRDARVVLPDVIGEIARALPWPKSMRWGATTFRWVRPLHGVLAIFDGKALPGGIDTGDGSLGYSNTTHGHRFMAPCSIEVSDFMEYSAGLKDAFVLIDPAERERVIRDQMDQACAASGLRVPDDDALFAEVAGLVEWPSLHIGTIDTDFMDLPREVLVSSMREHQKYFALETEDGRPAPNFAFVANIDAQSADAVIAGYERVLRARLSDAKYFWDLDREAPLESRVASLDGIVFHAKLGTVGDKVARVSRLAEYLSDKIQGASVSDVTRAAQLAKADLVTGMVGEFPDLQGVMGRYYAQAQGESAAVSDAIAEHYAPLGPNDRCPTAPVSVAVALADKLDTLTGFWSIDDKPTGSKDPFALRRAALGVIRLILENELRLDLREAVRFSAKLHSTEGDALVEDLIRFFADRLKVYLRDQGARHDRIDSVLGDKMPGELMSVVQRVAAVGEFLDSEDGANLLTAYRRAANIVRAESKKDAGEFRGADYVNEEALQDPAETLLVSKLAAVESDAATALEEEAFDRAMHALADLRAPLDAFFDEVTVNVDDSAARGNRLRLLARVQEVMNNVADFSKVEG
ncbi:MAG: glycine--tRNA ligase subunit beta [Alphaproteobacteria bacterium]|nr:glycine--tRNA ligase subunit beta [Alphaproteobacteria bacterium]